MNKIFAVSALAMFMAAGSATSGFTAGSVGHGNMSVFEGGQLVDKLSGQNPIAEDSLLVCDGKCLVKSQGISLVAADQAKFAIKNEDSVFNLYVRSGRVDYVINDSARKIAFHTPGGSYTVAEVIFNASSSSVVKGSVLVGESGETEILVTEGKLVFATADGMKTVDANNKIILAAEATAMVPPSAPVGSVAPILTTEAIVIGAAAGTAVTGVAVSNDNKDKKTASP